MGHDHGRVLGGGLVLHAEELQQGRRHVKIPDVSGEGVKNPSRPLKMGLSQNGS